MTMTQTPRRAPRAGIAAVLLPLMLVLFIANLDQTIVATALTSIGRAFGDVAASPWVATSYLVTSAITTLLFGKLGDTHGRRGVFILAIAVFLIGSALCAFAPSMWWLVAFRAFQGIGGGGLNSLVMAIIGELVPAKQRSKYQAYTSVVATVALVGGPLLGGLLVDTIGWPWIFLINLPVGVFGFVVTVARVHLAAPTAHNRVDVGGGILAALVSACTIIGVTLPSGGTLSWTSPAVLALLGAAAVGLMVFLLVERRAAEPILPLRLFRSAVFDIASVQFFLATLILFVGMLYVPVMLQSIQHLSGFTAGLFLIPELLGLIIATAIAGPRISKTGAYKQYPIIGAVLAGAGMTILGLLPATTPGWALIVPLLLAGAGVGLFVQVSLLAGQNAAPYTDLGAATGALNFFKSIGGALGSAIFSAVLIAAGGTLDPAAYRTVFLTTVPIAAFMLILAVLMPEKPLSDEMASIAAGDAEAPEY